MPRAAKKTLPEFELEVERLVFGGEGLGHWEGRPVFVFGALPGERVRVRPVQARRKFVKAELLEVVRASRDRLPPREEHYLACSPWQVMPYERQLFHKKEVTVSSWQKIAGELPSQDVVLVPGPRQLGYRNKLELSFTQDPEGRLTFGFNRRYRHQQYYSLERCVLGHDRINEAAVTVLEVLRGAGVAPEALKNLVVRSSFSLEQCLCVLYVTEPGFAPLEPDGADLQGWLVVYSDPRSPAAVVTRVLHRRGQEHLEEKLGGTTLAYGHDLFFQTNPEAFSLAVSHLRDRIRGGGTLVDLYAGVGTIGFLLAERFERVIAVEMHERAAEYARMNQARNATRGVVMITGKAEERELRSLMAAGDTLAVDPPRSGLHPKVLQAIEEHTPRQILYVSCNPTTQARDWARLKHLYAVADWTLFDFYPQTPHVESVLILER
ncbi:MAG: 23S rRNA (uracil(1939)-C(5))-methyltransferase RlmD [bacterium]